ncbi:hypothetical protein JCM10914A_50980 [Paenibacillus sp. JCM 10914]|uniref:GNAT family N-acetyltransferase n=1 Tax=Paenibacillus sp. JCM 10914 TaxID=1236974 RepID=UPI0003CC5526|nr:GNAT family N-acetyltransferase [Paenibacillus sp. JCM 10914]GAE05203.1 GCN5-related N-acetyltransferase [Paenibacillus sp. JCM 10914]
MEIMEIRRLEHMTNDIQQLLGQAGYTSYHQYQVKREMAPERLSIHIQRVPIDLPYQKSYEGSPEDIERYKEVLPMGYSLGGFVDDELVAIAVCEPSDWNHTLNVWEFHVMASFRRKNLGMSLMNKVIESAAAAGFRAVVVETQHTNAPAVDFYLRCGFELDGIDMSFYTNDDLEQGEVAFFMRRKIQKA